MEEYPDMAKKMAERFPPMSAVFQTRLVHMAAEAVAAAKALSVARRNTNVAQKSNKKNVMTVPFPLGKPPRAEYERIMSLGLAEKNKFKEELNAAQKTEVPYGPYPCNEKSFGLSWCQISFLPDSVKLEYIIFGMHLGLTVRVTSLRRDGKVSVWARSEEYDPSNRRMKVQGFNEGYPYAITVAKATKIILANRKNWPEYHKAMAKIKEQEDSKLAKARPPRKSPSRLGPAVTGANVLVSLSGRGRGPRPRQLQLTASESPPKKKVKVKGPKSAVVKVLSTQTPELTAALQKNLRKEKKILKKQQEYSNFERILKLDQSWEFNVSTDPTHMMRKILCLLHEAGDSESLLTCALRFMVPAHDQFKIQAARDWRDKAKQRVREIVSRNNQRLNDLTVARAKLEGTKAWKRTVVIANASTNVIDLQDSSDGEGPAQTGVDKGKGPAQPAKANGPSQTGVDKAKGPAQPANANGPSQSGDDKAKGPAQPANANGPSQTGVDKAKGPAQPANANGPSQSGDDKGKGPAQPANANGPAQTDFTKSDADFQSTRYIPKNETAKKHFRKCYPHGYPDNAHFVAHDHYIASNRSSFTGYKSVMFASATRSENYRVKIAGRTIGRYVKKAHACEDAYWHYKQDRQLREFMQRDALPSAMLE